MPVGRPGTCCPGSVCGRTEVATLAPRTMTAAAVPTAKRASLGEDFTVVLQMIDDPTIYVPAWSNVRSIRRLVTGDAHGFIDIRLTRASLVQRPFKFRVLSRSYCHREEARPVRLRSR